MTLDDAALLALARELPADLPSRAQREEVRTAVLAARARSAIGGSGRRMRASMVVVGTLASAAGVALALGFPTAPAAAPGRAELHAAPQPPHPLAPQDRVATTASPPHETITASSSPSPRETIAASPSPSRRKAVVTSPLPPRPPDPPKVSEPAPDELAYDAAWSALRAGELARAASGFARAHDLAPDGPLADDAAYWRAVALARAGQRGDAIAAFRTLLDDGARSVHAGAASAMLGWLLLDGGASRSEAGQRFRAAAEDLDPEVRASSRAGLAAIARGDE